MTADPWLLRPIRREGAAMRLFCLPYAGGSPNIFRSWALAIPAEVELVAIRLPGRDNRIREPAFTAWAPLLDAVEEVLRSCLDRPFMFFGHSFGARIAFELTKRLEDGGHPTPARLFVSGCRTPDDPLRSRCCTPCRGRSSTSASAR